MEGDNYTFLKKRCQICEYLLLIERVVGLEPTLFHIGSVVPYLLGDTLMFSFTNAMVVVVRDTILNILSDRQDLNLRPQPWQGCALPTELLSQEEDSVLPDYRDSSQTLCVLSWI